MSNLKEFTKGLIKENPNMVMLLGMCPTLAITTMAANGVGMGLSTTFVLVCSNIVISLLKKVIPDTVTSCIYSYSSRLCNICKPYITGFRPRHLFKPRYVP